MSMIAIHLQRHRQTLRGFGWKNILLVLGVTS